MTQDPVRSADLTRRQLLRSGAVGLGAMGLGLAASQLSTAAPANASTQVALDGAGQTDWRFCHYCYGLFYPGSASKCTGNSQGRGLGPHSVGSTDYISYYNESGYGYQSGWRYCSKCDLMHYSSGGLCPAGGAHSVGSRNYAFLAYELLGADPVVPAPYGIQSGWRYCSHCHGLWFAAGSSPGACPTYGGHIATGYHYYVVYK